tara:strand:+ start:1319 stop:1909 length:591 start_codon:yes stop_codon:yes gene_type:complete
MAKRKPLTASSWTFYNDHVNHLAIVEMAFTPEECKKIIKYATTFKNVKAQVGGKDQSVRKSNVTWIGIEDESRWLYEKLSGIIMDINDQYFKFDLTGITEQIQFTHYKHPDGKYEAHLDKLFNSTVRKLSVVLQLSDPTKYEGGELLIHQGPRPNVIKKSLGNLVIFPSYTLHEVKPVTKGQRYSLVIWVGGKPFK